MKMLTHTIQEHSLEKNDMLAVIITRRGQGQAMTSPYARLCRTQIATFVGMLTILMNESGDYDIGHYDIEVVFKKRNNLSSLQKRSFDKLLSEEVNRDRTPGKRVHFENTSAMDADDEMTCIDEGY